MGKPRKSRKNKFDYNKNRRKAFKKSKKLPSIPCGPIKNAWDERKSASRNLREMGLSADPNKTLAIPKTKDLIGRGKVTSDEAISSNAPCKAYVAQELEEEASHPHVSILRISHPTVQFCVYMMGKYGQDYKAMAKDPKNYYQETPKQIRKKINTFKNTPSQYDDYLASQKGEGKGKMDTS